MRQLYETYREDKKLSPLVRELSWTNNLLILSKCGSPEERGFYATWKTPPHICAVPSAERKTCSVSQTGNRKNWNAWNHWPHFAF